MQKSKTLKMGMALAVLGGALAPTMAFASPLYMDAPEYEIYYDGVPTTNDSAEILPESQTTKVVGTFEATTLDVSIPAVSTFSYNPNTEEMVAQDMLINSNTNAPVYMEMTEIEVSVESTWKPGLVLPTYYTADQWKNLTQAETKASVALGLNVQESDSFLTGILANNLWSESLGEGVKVGVIKTQEEVKVNPTLQAGTSINAEQILTANYIFEFGLE